jgi:broad specificity phosphatase PhoE
MGERQGLSVATGAAIQCSIESEADFLQRIMTWWNSIRAHIASLESRSDPYHLLVVAHGRFLKTLVRNLVNSGKAEREEKVVVGLRSCFNCSVTLLETGAIGVVKVIKYGDIEHLDKEQLAQGIVRVNVDEVDT